jgi:hypothetical protein
MLDRKKQKDPKDEQFEWLADELDAILDGNGFIGDKAKYDFGKRVGEKTL